MQFCYWEDIAYLKWQMGTNADLRTGNTKTWRHRRSSRCVKLTFQNPQNNFWIHQSHLHRIVVFVATRRSIILHNTQKIEFDGFKSWLKHNTSSHPLPANVVSTSNLVLIWKVRMCRGAKWLYIGSERYIEGFYGTDRADETCPHPATCLPDEDWR